MATNKTIGQVMQLEISPEGGAPLYLQIVEQVKSQVASGGLRPGQKLPTVRGLAQTLGLNPSTVAKAYAELEQEGIIATRRGGGSFVAAISSDHLLKSVREERLGGILGRAVLEALSLGFEPDEVDALFALHMARWRERRARREEIRASKLPVETNRILFAGSHDLTIELLASLLRRASPGMDFTAVYTGSLGGLIALERGEVHLAGAHLLDEETGQYNLPYVRRLLPNQNVVLVTLVERTQGLMVAKGNPKGISGLQDLCRRDVRFVNRQRESGTRVLLDHKLRELDMKPEEVHGYGREESTHLGVATAVADGTADVGLGIYAAARVLGLDFLPLLKERYDLVLLRENYEGVLLRPLFKVVKGEEFLRVVSAMGGYDVSKTGQVVAAT